MIDMTAARTAPQGGAAGRAPSPGMDTSGASGTPGATRGGQGTSGWAAWLKRLREHAAAREMVVLRGNTRDRVFVPEVVPLGHEEIPGARPVPPSFVAEYLALFFGKRYAVYYYSLDLGLVALVPPGYPRHNTALDALAGTPPGTPAASPARLLPELTQHLRNPETPLVLILDNAEHIAPPSTGMTAALTQDQLIVLETLARWPSDTAMRRTRNLVYLVANDGEVSAHLTRQAGYRTVTIPLPDETERAAFLNYLAERRAAGRLEYAKLPEDDRGLLATESGGLRNTDLEALSRQSAASGGPVSRDRVRQRKEQTIEELSDGSLTLLRSDHGLDAVVGQQHVREQLEEVIAQWRRGDRNVPRGILLAGVPGQGKTYSASAFAHDIGLPLLEVRNQRSPFVGESEQRQERDFWLIDSLSPVVVFIDEIDQMIGRRAAGGSGDSGTSERMFGGFLKFFGSEERRGRVILLAATNFPMGLDAAVLDRMNLVLPFLPPAPSDLIELLPAVARQLGLTLAEGVDLPSVAALPNLRWPTVRMVAEVLATAGRWASADVDKVGAPIEQTHLFAAALSAKPNYDPLMMERIALEAIRMTSMQHVLPWMTRHGRRDGYELPPYLRDLVDEQGQLDVRRLHARLVELASLTGGH